MSRRGTVRCRFGEVELCCRDEFRAAGDTWQIIQFDTDYIACRDAAGIINWFDPVFVAERVREEKVKN
jgi:hypothetical protein